jgi:hexokinase
MRYPRRALSAFLRRNRMSVDDIDINACCRAYGEEMTRGLEGRASSLPMIPTYIETARSVARGETVVALDVGGTNLRVARVSFDQQGKPVIEDLVRQRIPGIDAALERDEFFRAMAELVLPATRGVDRIGFCFSFPAEITPEKDGRLIQFTKEIKARGVEGELVGLNLGRALAAVGGREPSRIVVINDTVATLLAGRNAQPGRHFDDFIGLVCGTGLNAAYVERNSLITKTKGLDSDGSMIVNTESGSFGGWPRGRVDDEFDATMANPGKYRNEKAISGAYLGALCFFAVRSAARAGLLSAQAGKELERVPSLSTPELNDFLFFPDTPSNPLGVVCGRLSADDARDMYTICDAIVERAALLVAVDLGAILLKTDSGHDPRFPVCMTVDGTTFWQVRSFRSRVEHHMRRLLRGPLARAWEINGVVDAPLLGSAIAALTN